MWSSSTVVDAVCCQVLYQSRPSQKSDKKQKSLNWLWAHLKKSLVQPITICIHSECAGIYNVKFGSLWTSGWLTQALLLYPSIPDHAATFNKHSRCCRLHRPSDNGAGFKPSIGNRTCPMNNDSSFCRSTLRRGVFCMALNMYRTILSFGRNSKVTMCFNAFYCHLELHR